MLDVDDFTDSEFSYGQVIRATVSLPRLQLVKADRPIFECPVCYSCNDRLPVCFWCKSTSPESAAAFWCSMPKQRTISAPVHMTYWSCANNSTKSISIATPVSTAVGAGKAQEVRLFCQTCYLLPFPPFFFFLCFFSIAIEKGAILQLGDILYINNETTRRTWLCPVLCTI